MTQHFPLEAVNQSVMDVCFQPELETLKRKTTTKACTKMIKYEMNETGVYITGFHVSLLFCPLPLSCASALRRAAVATKVKIQPLCTPSGFPSPAFSARSDPRRRVGQMGRGPILMDEWRQDAARKRARLPLLSRTACACVCTHTCTLSLSCRMQLQNQDTGSLFCIKISV